MRKANQSDNKNTRKKRKNPFLRWFWTLFAIGIAGVLLLFLSASLGLLGEMPDFKHLENPETNLATEIVTADGKSLGKF